MNYEMLRGKSPYELIEDIPELNCKGLRQPVMTPQIGLTLFELTPDTFLCDISHMGTDGIILYRPIEAHFGNKEIRDETALMLKHGATRYAGKCACVLEIVDDADKEFVMVSATKLNTIVDAVNHYIVPRSHPVPNTPRETFTVSEDGTLLSSQVNLNGKLNIIIQALLPVITDDESVMEVIAVGQNLLNLTPSVAFLEEADHNRYFCLGDEKVCVNYLTDMQWSLLQNNLRAGYRSLAHGRANADQRTYRDTVKEEIYDRYGVRVQ